MSMLTMKHVATQASCNTTFRSYARDQPRVCVNAWQSLQRHPLSSYSRRKTIFLMCQPRRANKSEPQFWVNKWGATSMARSCTSHRSKAAAARGTCEKKQTDKQSRADKKSTANRTERTQHSTKTNGATQTRAEGANQISQAS